MGTIVTVVVLVIKDCVLKVCSVQAYRVEAMYVLEEVRHPHQSLGSYVRKVGVVPKAYFA
jgi:hypothetical protein